MYGNMYEWWGWLYTSCDADAVDYTIPYVYMCTHTLTEAEFI